MRLLLIVLMLSISACATIDVPEVSRALRDYEPQLAEPMQGATPLPGIQFSGTTMVAGEEVVYLTEAQFAKVEQFIEAAKGNTEALKHRTMALQATLRERDHLLAAGQAAEGQAALYRELYQGEARYCRVVQVVSVGVAGLVLVVGAL